jgi:hypothetical protein|tara:strand:+ start:891 stop:1082 length:192 start_codon:yes stop_codon:yes gene_type:complete
MSRVAPEDSQIISHIEFTCDNIHNLSNNLYENMMDRDYGEAKKDCKKLITILEDIIKSMEDEL